MSPSEPMYPRASLREIALALMAADDLMNDYDTVEEALAQGRKLVYAVETEPYWANGRHEGDCTSQPHTCDRCVIEEYEERAKALVVAEGFNTRDAADQPQGSALKTMPSWFADPDFLAEVTARVVEIRALDEEEDRCGDLDDRIGLRQRRLGLERWLGHHIVERIIDAEISTG